MIVTDQQSNESLSFIHNNASLSGALKGKIYAYEYQLKVIEAEGMKASEGGAEIRKMYARSSDAYKQLVNKMKSAQETYHDIESQIRFHYACIECWRTECANRRGIQ